MMQGLRGSGESMPQKTTKKKQQDSKEEGEVCVCWISEWREHILKNKMDFSEGISDALMAKCVGELRGLLVRFGEFLLLFKCFQVV